MAPAGALSSHRERRSGPFRRALPLVGPIDPGGAWAEFRHGTWLIQLPKRRRDERLSEGVAPDKPEAGRVIRITTR